MVSEDDLAPYYSSLKELGVIAVEEKFYDVIQSCDIILTASGTATLEIGLLEVPMVIVYKVAALSYFILSRLVNIKHLGLVNIVPGKEIVKEFIQHQAQPEAIAEEALRLLNDKTYYKAMHDNLSLIRQQLGDGKGSEKVAALAYNMLMENKNKIND